MCAAVKSYVLLPPEQAVKEDADKAKGPAEAEDEQ